MNKSIVTHVTKGNISDDLGFGPEDALAIKVRSEILMEIQDHIRRKGYTQKQLVELLSEHQSVVSKLINGKLSSLTIDRLLRYASRLNLGAQVTVAPVKAGKPSKAKQVASPKAAWLL
ncbi:MAG: helix-turn-helix domain-containing protein [Terracidiphilus sp.]